MRNIIDKILKNKKTILITVAFATASLFFVLTNSAIAASQTTSLGVTDVISKGVGTAVATVLSWVAWVFLMVFGLLLTLLIQILVNVAGFSNIINVAAVINGWVIIRDLCNMFFILILLVVAFATILRIETYQWKKILPKLLIMAVLINFSKTICGLIIDFAQVIMLTFVNGFSQYGPANFISMFQTNKIAALWTGADVSSWGVVVGIIAGVIALIITNIVVIVMLAVLIARVIMLWVYTILSPIAFLAAAFPAGQKYASQWWSEFSKQVVVGPVLAFFIWLALTTSQQSSTDVGTLAASSKDICAGASTFFCESSFQTFILTIGLLAGGLMVTQQMGGIAASIAGKGMAAIQKVGKSTLLPLVGAKTLAGYGIDKLHEKTGVDLNVARVWTGLQEKRADIKKKRYGRGMIKASEAMRERGRLYGALAMTGTPGQAWEQLTTVQGWKRRFRGGIKGKEEIKKLSEVRDVSKKSIEKIETSDEYKKSLEISKAITPEKRHDLSLEQGRLVDELDKLASAIELVENDIKVAKAHKDEVAEKIATDKLAGLKMQKKSKIDIIASNEHELGQPVHSLGEIYKAQNFIEDKDKEIATHKESIAKTNDQILDYKPIMDFDAIAMQGSLESEEIKKIDHIKDREELASLLRDAIKNKDRSRFNAISLKLTKDGNENDGVLNNMGYNSNADGLNKMIKAISTKGDKNYMGYSDQEAKALGMKISYAAEANNHWGTARAFTMEDGRYRDSSAKEQAMAAISEIAKMDPQGISRQLNRLGYGGETPDGKFILNEYGLALLKTIGPKVAEQMSRFNPNALPRLSTPENIKLMVEVGVAPEFIAGLTTKIDSKTGAPKSQTPKAADAVNLLFKE